MFHSSTLSILYSFVCGKQGKKRVKSGEKRAVIGSPLFLPPTSSTYVALSLTNSAFSTSTIKYWHPVCFLAIIRFN